MDIGHTKDALRKLKNIKQEPIFRKENVGHAHTKSRVPTDGWRIMYGFHKIISLLAIGRMKNVAKKL